MFWSVVDSYPFPCSSLILLLIIMVHFFSKRQLPVMRNRIFMASIVAACVDALLCIAAVGAARHTGEISYSRGLTVTAVYNVVHTLALFLCLFCAVYAIVRRFFKREHAKLWIGAGFALSTSMVLAVQAIRPTYYISAFAILASMLVSSFSIKSPETMLDHLTDLLNLDAMMAYTDELISRGVRYYVIVMKVENIRRINSIFGYTVGTMTLKNVADFLSTFSPDLKERSRLRKHTSSENAPLSAGDARKLEKTLPAAWAFRLMSNQFAIVSTSSSTHETILNAIHERFEEPWYIRGLELNLMDTIAEITETGSFSNGEDLYKVVEITLPSLPKGDTVTLSERALLKIKRQISLESALEQAIENESLEVRFQPICFSRNGHVTRVEALARFPHQEWGEVPPDEFIPVAEKRGLISQIDTFVLRRACEWLRETEAEGLEVDGIHVNISVTEMASSAFSSNVCRILDEYGIKYGRVTFEIEETALLSGLNMIIPNLEHLAALGFGFAVDNMSIGQSSLSHLAILPFSIVKLSRLALEAAETSPKDMLLFENTIDVLRKMEIRSVVVGAETEARSELIVSSSADMIQGFYYARPMEGKACRAFIRKNHAQEGKRPGKGDFIVVAE